MSCLAEMAEKLSMNFFAVSVDITRLKEAVEAIP
jgi:hypothetical protein